MVVTETIYSMASSQSSLSLASFREAKVIESKVRWNVGLVMASEQGFCFRYISPLRKALSPPFVIFSNGMKLREVNGEQADTSALLRGVIKIHPPNYHII